MFGLDSVEVVAIGIMVLLAVSLLGSALSHRGLRDGFIWVLIFLGVIGVASRWDVITDGVTQSQVTYIGGRVEVPKSADNHFRLTMQINGVDVDFLVDTGASEVVLTQADAARVGLDPATLPYIGIAMTANGSVATAPVRLATVDLGEIRDTRVPASVNSGAMDTSLLGMSYLSRFESIEITRDTLILNR